MHREGTLLSARAQLMHHQPDVLLWQEDCDAGDAALAITRMPATDVAADGATTALSAPTCWAPTRDAFPDFNTTSHDTGAGETHPTSLRGNSWLESADVTWLGGEGATGLDSWDLFEDEVTPDATAATGAAAAAQCCRVGSRGGGKNGIIDDLFGLDFSGALPPTPEQMVKSAGGLLRETARGSRLNAVVGGAGRVQVEAA